MRLIRLFLRLSYRSRISRWFLLAPVDGVLGGLGFGVGVGVGVIAGLLGSSVSGLSQCRVAAFCLGGLLE